MRCLNQWTLRPVPAVVDILGNGNATATVTVNGQSTYRKNEYFYKALTVGNGVYASVTVSATSGSTVNQSGSVFVPAATETYTPDADGNLTQDGRWDYTWDAENRLIVMKTRSGIAGPVRRLEFEYDCFGRRIRKRVYDALSGGNLLLERKFVYSGWNVLAEMDGSNNLVRSYAWGLDLSGTSQGAGGVGGLLYVKPAGGVAHFCAYDGNGNVMALVDGATGNSSAEYEYGAFGETIRMTGTLATANPFRLSTKYCDDETDFYYYGYRYYNPSTGRWPSRDPIGERGGGNLYGFVGNDPVNFIDPLGLYEVDVHKYLTQFLAEKAGFCSPKAFKVGEQTQALDDPGSDRDAMFDGRNLPNMENFHFVNQGRLAELRKKALAGCVCKEAQRDWKAIGEYLHALEDTYAHSTGKGDRNWDYYDGPLRMGVNVPSFTVIPATPVSGAIGFPGADIHAGYNMGHGARGHQPDQTWNDPAKAMKMAEMLFNELKDLAKSCGGGCPVSTWDAIKPNVQSFVGFKADTYTQWYRRGVAVANATFGGYNQKIKLLDPAFILDPEYRKVFAK